MQRLISITYMSKLDDLHARIRSTRLRLGLSQADLAELTGVTQPTVANWESGSHIPRQPAIVRIAKALNIEPGWLMSGDATEISSALATYLSRPVQHVPVYAVGDRIGVDTPQVPVDYVPVSTDRINLIGLQTEHNTFLIVDPENGSGEDTGITVWQIGLDVETGHQNDMPEGATRLGSLIMEIKRFAE